MRIDEYAMMFVGEPYSWGTWSVCEWVVQEALKEFGLMTEKKTFKNVEVVPYAADQWYVRELNGRTHGYFASHEWDMEITFTKKSEPIHVGDMVNHDEGSYGPYKVLGIDEAREEIWLKDCDGDNNVWDLFGAHKISD